MSKRQSSDARRRATPEMPIPSRLEATLPPPMPATAPGQFPTVRLRRTRQAAWSRRLVAENVLTTGDLIWPLFLIDSKER